ncbi:MAG TPA: choice-of-anchor B family protein [Gemmatimonadales bacterium]|jgi:choice-of-anchor B domain-containing protein|nr:choice-of-anchor B family protein [Gemmatimonadales bacterium]
MSHRTLRLIALLPLLPTAAAAQWKVSQPGEFGHAIAIAGRELFISQPGNPYAPGMVYVYRASANGAWSAAAKLTMQGAGNGDDFGRALALDPASGLLLISSGVADSGRGVVFVFTRAGTQWTQTARVTAPDGRPGDGFGKTVVLAGARAYVSSNRQKGRGAVYVFKKTGGGGGTFVAETTLAPTDTLPNQAFGAAIAVQGNRLLIGSADADSNAGAVYAYTRDTTTGTWKMEQRIPSPWRMGSRGATWQGAHFGSALLLRGDTMFVGAPNDRFSGAVWIFARDTTSGQWGLERRVLPFDGIWLSRFGASLAEVGSELWVGAPGVDNRQGRIYRVTRDSTGIKSSVKWGIPQLGEAGFGGTLAVSGSLAVIGLTGLDHEEGGVAIFNRRPTGAWTLAARLTGEVTTLPPITGASRECTGNKVGIFDCHQVDLLSFLPIPAIGGKRGVQLSDVWGYTDAETGREYVIVGRIDGTSFVDISDPSRPRYLGDLPKTAGTPSSVWREIKTYKHYAFIVADGARAHGMQVFDMHRLRDVTIPVTFTEDAHYGTVHSAHDIASDTVSGYMYLTAAGWGGIDCGGGLHIVDVRDPLHPTFAGCFNDPQTGMGRPGQTHDAQCVVYHGPHTKYQGRQICFGFNETALSIADVTDKAHTVAISRGTYPNSAYIHQGWLTEDQRYIYEDDELDEMNGLVDGTRTLIWDVSDLENPLLAGQYISKSRASDHNQYIVGNTLYQANYVSGLRVLDITDRLHPVEIGYFDTRPVGPDEPAFLGAWGNYPFFKSGVVAVSSMGEGVFILKKRATPPVP